MPLNRQEIAGLIPHTGNMCLLERVETWGEDSIHCVADSHRDPANPLRRDDCLPAVCAVEYAAQAMAAHGALIAGQSDQPRVGLLASVRNLRLQVPALDGLPDLDIRATLLAREASRVMYEFTVRAGTIDVVSGRAAIVLRLEERV